ncbi:methyltransferase domain-containing protein [Lysobacter arenosi]|jgi:SAM-dependent methyltransferase|uniref:Methyltransferase domain-containing protein n=1 Tax=Lysobacter arenosi TaxID=2795387 RepID=A0ABX7R683_9GAMM|nr:class I SAM-dependent methyltransferase [Lysobacter arenosi]QSX73554.1 methyltransferase domain-containing protein [Lysobacter arenosi]
MGTDRDWEQWGAADPYFGVCSSERFRTDSMTGEAKSEFFASGEEHIARTVRNLKDAFGSGFEPGSALDFGCGVGRLVIPLARRADRVTAVDISPSMIAEARRNCDAAGVSNVTFIESDDGLSRASGEFDLVHSHIVLQHIPWRRGRVILQSLADRVSPGGCLAVQILTGHNDSPIVRGLVRLRYAFPPANWLRNILRGRPVFEPAMQLHVYHLDVVLRDLEARGFSCRHHDEPWAEFRNTFLYAHRETA